MQSRFRDWGDVRIFLAVVREGSTLAAARVLGINQTTVARRLDVLEQAVGLKLFEKTTRGSVPTDAANALLANAEQLEQCALAFDAQAEAERGRARAPIRITAFDHAMMGNIGQIVSEFVRETPDVTFEFIAAERMLDLMKGEADVALRMTPNIPDDRLIARRVGETKWTYYAAQTYADQRDLPKAYVPDMEDHCVILLGHIASTRKNILRCASANDVRMAIQAGQGIGPLPVFDGDSHPGLVRCFDPPDGADLPVWLITSPTAHKRPEVRSFTAFAAPRLARNLKKAMA